MEDILIKDLGSEMYYWIDAILYLIFAITVLYLLFFAIISLFKRKDEYPIAEENYKIAVVILAFDSNWDAKECLSSYLNQDYPSDRYKIFVVGTNITQSMQNNLRNMNIDCENYEKTTLRRTLLSHFISELDEKEEFEFIAINRVCDRVDSTFLSKVNNALYSGCDVVQTHSKLADEKSIWNIYKSMSSEINNSIFRKAHCYCSLSSALSSSGVIFKIDVLKACLKKKTHVGLEKTCEKILLQNNYYIEYLDNVFTYEETSASVSYNERQKYSYYLTNMIKTFFYMPFAVLQGNIDYIAKLFQWILPPRLILIVTIGIFGALASYIDIFTSIKWWVLLTILITTFFIAIPSSLVAGRLFKIFLMIPVYVLYIPFNMIYKRVKR